MSCQHCVGHTASGRGPPACNTGHRSDWKEEPRGRQLVYYYGGDPSLAVSEEPRIQTSGDRTMSAAISVGPCRAFAFSYENASAVSDEASVVSEESCDWLWKAEQSQALCGRKSMLMSELVDVAEECSEDDWDGYGGLAVCRDAVFNAGAFIFALPDEYPLPEIAPEPDGALSFDWIRDRHHRVTISVDADDRLAYAWLSGTDKGHAVARFNGKEIPSLILACIQNIVSG